MVPGGRPRSGSRPLLSPEDLHPRESALALFDASIDAVKARLVEAQRVRPNSAPTCGKGNAVYADAADKRIGSASLPRRAVDVTEEFVEARKECLDGRRSGRKAMVPANSGDSNYRKMVAGQRALSKGKSSKRTERRPQSAPEGRDGGTSNPVGRARRSFSMGSTSPKQQANFSRKIRSACAEAALEDSDGSIISYVPSELMVFQQQFAQELKVRRRMSEEQNAKQMPKRPQENLATPLSPTLLASVPLAEGTVLSIGGNQHDFLMPAAAANDLVGGVPRLVLAAIVTTGIRSRLGKAGDIGAV